MATELLIASNPSGRRKRRMSPKQRAAALRNLKKARRARTGGKRRRNPVGMYLAPNPKRRKRRASSARRAVRRRRNPIGFKLSPRGIMAKAMPALIGGGGAVANDLLYNFAVNALPPTLPMLEQFRTGQLRHVGKAVSALLLATLAGFVLPRRIAEQMGTGALTVVGYNVVREAVTRFVPGVNMGMYLEPGLGWAGAGWNPAYGRGANWEGSRDRAGLSAYLRANNGGGANGGGLLKTAPQFKTASPFTARAAVYADEVEG